MQDSIARQIPPTAAPASTARDGDHRLAANSVSKSTLTLPGRSAARAAPPSHPGHARMAPGARIQVRTRGDSAVRTIERVIAAGVNQSSRVRADGDNDAARWAE